MTSEILGGYRLTDGTYSRELFEIPTDFFKRKTLELSRAWVRSEMQGKLLPHLLSGIGRFIGNNPDYEQLIGMVSASQDYDSPSLQLLAETVKMVAGRSEFADLIRPRNPVDLNQLSSDEMKAYLEQISSYRDLDRVLKLRNPDSPGAPQLFGSYQLFGAKLMAINRDPGFSNTTDFLMSADLLAMSRKIRIRFMGPVGDENFRIRHQLP